MTGPKRIRLRTPADLGACILIREAGHRLLPAAVRGAQPPSRLEDGPEHLVDYRGC